MKQGWVMVDYGGGKKETLVPKTMADQVYVDTVGGQTVKAAMPSEAAPLAVNRGGTGTTNAYSAKRNLGIRTGSVTIPNVPGKGRGSVRLYFNTEGTPWFTAFPYVAVTPGSVIPDLRCTSVFNLSRDFVDVYVSNGAEETTNLAVYYIAIG